MKTVVLALLVLLVVSQSEALKCNCGGRKICSNRVETCHPPANACASVIFHVGSTPSYFKRCMKLSDCEMLNHPDISTSYCCTTDLCN